MKKGIRIFLVLLTFIFFAQVCFANYAINPEVQKSITEYDEKQTDYDPEKKERKKRPGLAIIVVVLIILGIAVGVVLLVSVIYALIMGIEDVVDMNFSNGAVVLDGL